MTRVGTKSLARSPQVPDLTSYGDDEQEARANVQASLDSLGRAKRRLISVARLVEDDFAKRYAREKTHAFIARFVDEAVVR